MSSKSLPCKRPLPQHLFSIANIKIRDVTDRESVQSAYETCKKTLPPIAGVANAAMLMRDGFFLDMSLENMEDSIKPKVDGTNNLNELFGNSPLDFFILFSSLACVIGNDGQSNYSAANMYMTAIAHQRKSRGLAGSVMDIGRVVGVGYLERGHQEVDKRLAKHGMMAVSETDLHHIFAEAIMAGRPDSDRNPELITGELLFPFHHFFCFLTFFRLELYVISRALLEKAVGYQDIC